MEIHFNSVQDSPVPKYNMEMESPQQIRNWITDEPFCQEIRDEERKI
jgi:hypothetical protein